MFKILFQYTFNVFLASSLFNGPWLVASRVYHPGIRATDGGTARSLPISCLRSQGIFNIFGAIHSGQNLSENKPIFIEVFHRWYYILTAKKILRLPLALAVKYITPV